MKQVCEAINRKLGIEAGTVPMSLDEASWRHIWQSESDKIIEQDMA
jgi:hypothetical protein